MKDIHNKFYFIVSVENAVYRLLIKKQMRPVNCNRKLLLFELSFRYRILFDSIEIVSAC